MALGGALAQDVGRGLRILGEKDGMPPLPDLDFAIFQRGPAWAPRLRARGSAGTADARARIKGEPSERQHARRDDKEPLLVVGLRTVIAPAGVRLRRRAADTAMCRGWLKLPLCTRSVVARK